jgi:hypothetical protein
MRNEINEAHEAVEDSGYSSDAKKKLLFQEKS